MNIAIIEKNNFYRESLKTALNQIIDFKVVFDADNIFSFYQSTDKYDFHIVLLDFTFYQNENITKIFQLLPYIRILILSNYTENCFFNIQIDNTFLDFISKCSDKKKFEQKIRKFLNFNIVSI